MAEPITFEYLDGQEATYYPAVIIAGVRDNGMQVGVRVNEDGTVEYLGGYEPDQVSHVIMQHVGQALARLLPNPERMMPPHSHGAH